jgi:hypothetical protein
VNFGGYTFGVSPFLSIEIEATSTKPVVSKGFTGTEALVYSGIVATYSCGYPS